MSESSMTQNEWNIGPYRVHAVDNTMFALDGGSMYGSIPQTLWKKFDKPNQFNRIRLSARSLLLVSGDARIMVDCGLGTKWNDKLASIYEVDNESVNTESSLAALGLTPADITHVILSHLHFDHAGGSTSLVDGKIVPTFPNATYFAQKRNLEWAKQPCDKDAASFMSDDFLPLVETGQMQTVDGEKEILPHISVKVFNGHTEAMQCPLVEYKDQRLFYCADLIPLAAHLRYPYIMGYDLRPVTTLNEKKAVLKQALSENWNLFFEHEPTAAAVSLAMGKRYPEIKDRLI